MIKTRIATTAALITFALAALSGILIAIATPANADASTTVDGTAMAGTAGQAVDDARAVAEELAAATRGPDVARVRAPGSAATQLHVTFPYSAAPHSEHNGQGHKGSNELPHAHRPDANVFVPQPIRGRSHGRR